MRILSRVKALEASGKKVIRLEIGESDFGLPEPIKRGALEAIQKGYPRKENRELTYRFEHEFKFQFHAIALIR